MQYQFGPGPLKADYDPLIQKLKSDIGIVEDGNTATHAIATGQYVVWKGSLYVARSDIQIGATLTSASGGNLTVKPNGIGNEVVELKATKNARSSVALSSNDDCDDCIDTTKVYRASLGNNPAHAPWSGGGFDILTVDGGWGHIQIATVYNSVGEIRIRRQYYSGWTGWIKFSGIAV